MKIIEPGHIYDLQVLDSNPTIEASRVIPPNRLVFLNREKGHQHPGYQTQEVLRALIDRTRHCNNCLPHETDARIIYHLRMALVLHETRALERKIEKGYMLPEYVITGTDGHFSFAEAARPSGAAEDIYTTAQVETPDLTKDVPK